MLLHGGLFLTTRVGFHVSGLSIVHVAKIRLMP